GYMDNMPGWQLTYPYICYDGRMRSQAYATKWHQPHKTPPEVLAPGTYVQARLGCLAETLERPVYLSWNDGGPQVISCAAPSPAIQNIFWHGSLALETLTAPALAAHSRDVLLLGLLILIATVLSWRTAGWFLEPLLGLAKAARLVMRRTFTVRLPGERDDELGELERAFNVMVQGVAEGRLLRRFVSTAVRKTASDTGRSRKARDGESIDAVILFMEPTSFGIRQKTTPPPELIKAVNAWLDAMSRCIQEHGGEIDKFMGAKILAVFEPAKLGSLSQARRAALLAAGAAAHVMAGLDAWHGDSPSIGIATGSVLAGILGNDRVRLEYTVIGDTVNLAARLCDVAKKRGGTIVLDHATLDQKPTDAGTFESIGEITVKGKQEAIEAYIFKPI
ncbi:MAG TPA: adenylate/guanylate cyclase domain-containing protein, partial [Candidatus Ozemobacteraceae bacterium]|nr:adenylate/guanylate cyclase domain-containing protein [Candidatus Ozemobacteraceae bacterium]